MLLSSNMPTRLTNFFLVWLMTTTVGSEFRPNFTAKSLHNKSEYKDAITANTRMQQGCLSGGDHLWQTPSTCANLYALPPPAFARTASIIATCSLTLSSPSSPSSTAIAQRPMSPQARASDRS